MISVTVLSHPRQLGGFLNGPINRKRRIILMSKYQVIRVCGTFLLLQGMCYYDVTFLCASRLEPETEEA